MLAHDIQERLKELACLYAISDITAGPGSHFDDILQKIADRIPLGFQVPESVCACVTVFDRAIKTANFHPCRWKLEADLAVNEQITGKLEVGYLGGLLDEKSPFLEEEKKLLQAIAFRVEMAIHCKILEESLEKSENRYRNLVENALVGIFQTNLRGDLLYANPMCLRMFGYDSLEEARSAGPVGRYRNPEDRKAIIESLARTGKFTNFEAEFMTKNGASLFVLFSAILESDVITGMMMDITERKLAGEAMIRSEKRLSEAQRLAHLGSWDWDKDTSELRWSDELYRIFGLLPQEIRPTHEAFMSFVHPDDRQAVQEAVNQFLAYPGKAYSMEHRVVRFDGHECVVQGCGVITFDEERRPVQIMGTVQDITARKQTEKKLHDALDTIEVLKERLEAENIYLREEIKLKDEHEVIFGPSAAIQATVRRCGQVARTDTTVLFTGETGTGKNAFASYLHRKSSRRDKPFVNVNCAGLPANLIESELFGREKGAFTGSTARQIGRFELARGGTIFLDEIGELPLELQAKLLKVIDTGEFERLGSPHSVKVDVRIIASTNRNLEEEIKNGRFRQDLFFRINVFPISIPPLRERKGDVPFFVKAYLEKFRKNYNKGIITIPPETMEILENYSWPGNVRELINVIERAVIVSEGPELQLSEMEIRSMRPLPPADTVDGWDALSGKELLEVEKEYILKTLRSTGWRISGPRGAAQGLGINPSTLRARIKKLGIIRPGCRD